MGFSDPVVAGNVLVRDAIRSPNYVPGASGWSINKDGSIEANDITSRGPVTVVDDQGNAVGSIDDAGKGTFSALSVTDDDITIGGSLLLAEILDPRPRGVVAWGIVNVGGVDTTSEIGLGELAFTAEDGRLYRITVSDLLVTVDQDQQVAGLRLRNTSDGTSPELTSPILGYGYGKTSGTSGQQSLRFARTFRCYSGAYAAEYGVEPGMNRLLACLYSTGGMTATIYGGAVNYVQFIVEDIGAYLPDTGYFNNGGGGGGTAPTTRTTTWNATWTGSYLGDNSRRNSSGSIYQGTFSPNGNQRSMIGFNYADIQSKLSGATINSCYVYLYYAHWYYNAGGTALLGTHTSTAGSAPSTWSGSARRVTSASWPNPGGRWVSLGTGIGAEFKTGASRGIVIGPQSGSDLTFYGYANGTGQSHPPMLKITYTK